MIDMTSDDIIRTYSDTFVGWMNEDTGKVAPAYVAGSEDRNSLTLNVYNRGNPERRIANINDPLLVLSYPDSGAYNVSKGRAAFISRKPQRQWRRGISQRHLSITGDVAFDYRVVRSMFNPRYMPYDAALAVVSKGDGSSAAIDHRFWLRNRPVFANPVIYFRSRVVGEIKDGERVIKSPAIAALFEEVISENQ